MTSCNAGRGNCNTESTSRDGCEVNLTHDPNNCYGCGTRCKAPPHATAGCDVTVVPTRAALNFVGAATWEALSGNPVETEVWPVLLHEAARAGVPMVLANARLSAKSQRKGERLSVVLHPAAASLARVLTQTEADALRLRASGAVDVVVCGNLKFDLTPNAERVAQGQAWRAQLGRPVVMAAVIEHGTPLVDDPDRVGPPDPEPETGDLGGPRGDGRAVSVDQGVHPGVVVGGVAVGACRPAGAVPDDGGGGQSDGEGGEGFHSDTTRRT